MKKCYILDLDDKRALQETRTGGKGASLAWLRRHRFKTPPGFVITAAAFRDYLESFGVEAITGRNSWMPSELRLINTFIQENALPDVLQRPILRAYRRLGGRVAVRSSMFGEDANTASFAGQLDTVLNVAGETAVLQAVQRCWASVFNERLVRYLDQREQLTFQTLVDTFSIAVVVQRMVDAEAAGVAFSADPLTGRRCIIIEAARGLGDALVNGQVTPDRYVVDARGVLTEQMLADGETPILQEKMVLTLAQLVRRIADRRTAQQDIEWARDGQDIYLLQSRPITTLVGKRLYSNAMVGEMLPGLIKPLVWSVSTQSKLKNVLGRIFTELLGPNDLDFTKLAKRIHSRIYADNTMLGSLLEAMGLPANFFEMMSNEEKAEHRQRMPLNGRTLRTMIRIMGFVRRNANPVDEIKRYLGQHEEALRPFASTDWAGTSTKELLARFQDLIQLYNESMWFNFIGPMNMMIRNRLLHHLVAQWTPDIAPNDLIRGLIGLKSLETNEALHALAVEAASFDGDICALLRTDDDATIRRSLLDVPGGADFVARVDAFLDRYGFFNASGTDLSRTPWIENPLFIWHAIGRTADGLTPLHARDNHQIRAEAREQIQAQLNPFRRWIFDKVLHSAVTYIDLRERTSILISKDSYEMRRIVLTLGDRWVKDGTLTARDDVFYLSLDELRGLVNGTYSATEIRALVAERRAEMLRDADLELPDTFYEGYEPGKRAVPLPEMPYLSGITGCAGVVSGHARIVMEPSAAPARLDATDILIVPFTDVSWTPLFAGIGGLVAETGGQLSHSAIVAREYGLPAVVNVKNATQLIKEGQEIVVDGTQGHVRLG